MGTDDLFHKKKARLAESHRREKRQGAGETVVRTKPCSGALKSPADGCIGS